MCGHNTGLDKWNDDVQPLYWEPDCEAGVDIIGEHHDGIVDVRPKQRGD